MGSVFFFFFLALPLQAHSDRNITSADTKPDGRVVTVKFTGTVLGDLPVGFKPTVSTMQVELGKKYEMAYSFENRSPKDLPILATHSVEPTEAGAMFKKFVCFCFEDQTLKGNIKTDMPIVFVISSKLPKNVTTLDINYRLYLKKAPDVKPAVGGKYQNANKG